MEAIGAVDEPCIHADEITLPAHFAYQQRLNAERARRRRPINRFAVKAVYRAARDHAEGRHSRERAAV